LKKFIYLFLFIPLLFSCNKNNENEIVFLAKGYIENYLIIINNETIICINYDNREIDDLKLLQRLKIDDYNDITYNESLREDLINVVEKYREEENSLVETYLNNKDDLYDSLSLIVQNYNKSNLLLVLEKIEKQKVYCFNNLEDIKDSANYLALWLEQVKLLEKRNDL